MKAMNMSCKCLETFRVNNGPSLESYEKLSLIDLTNLGECTVHRVLHTALISNRSSLNKRKEWYKYIKPEANYLSGWRESLEGE